jgi:predicted RNase H-like HicB family nuclease
MAKKSVKRAGKMVATEAALGRPFDPDILDRARKLANKYRIVLEPEEDCGFIASSLELPNVYADGASANLAVTAEREALSAAVAYLLEMGQTPPAPAADQIRDRQINIRLTECEQRLLKEAARAHNCSDMSEYVRGRVLSA